MIDRRHWLRVGAFWLVVLLTTYILPAGAAAPATVPALNGLFITKPGDTSHVTSPIQVEAEMTVAERGSIRVELVDEDGRVIARKSYAFRTCEDAAPGGREDVYVLTEPVSFCGGRRVSLTTGLAFGMAVGHQAARLQISILDVDQHTLTSNSVGLTLLESGTAKIVNQKPGEQGIRLTEPEDGASISAKTLVIAGEAPPTHILPMRVEVVTLAGKALGSRMVSAVHPAGQSGETQKGIFRVEIPLRLKIQQPALITVTAADENIPGNRYIASRAVTLLP